MLHFRHFCLCRGFHYLAWQCSCSFTNTVPSSCIIKVRVVSLAFVLHIFISTVQFGIPCLPTETLCCLEAPCGKVSELPAPELHKGKNHREMKDVTLSSTDWQMLLQQPSEALCLLLYISSEQKRRAVAAVIAKTIWGRQNLSTKFWSGQYA